MKRYKVIAVCALLLAAAVVPQVTQASTTTDTVWTDAAFQAYENGYMIWRGDTGGIWVLAGWRATYYAQSTYENLVDNPITDPAPAGLVKPVSGFGYVWGNFAEVRDALGWAVSPEIGYTMRFGPSSYTAGGLRQNAVTFPDGQEIVIRDDGSWQFNDGTPRHIASLPSPTSMASIVQAFEHGYMMYWPETGSIWVLIERSNAILYNSTDYGALPDISSTLMPPSGYYAPILGFGKVWGNYPEVRERLGWAIGAEQGYTAQYERYYLQQTVIMGFGSGYKVTFPNGQWIKIIDAGFWEFE